MLKKANEIELTDYEELICIDEIEQEAEKAAVLVYLDGLIDILQHAKKNRLILYTSDLGVVGGAMRWFARHIDGGDAEFYDRCNGNPRLMALLGFTLPATETDAPERSEATNSAEEATEEQQDHQAACETRLAAALDKFGAAVDEFATEEVAESEDDKGPIPALVAQKMSDFFAKVSTLDINSPHRIGYVARQMSFIAKDLCEPFGDGDLFQRAYAGDFDDSEFMQKLANLSS